MQELGAAVQHDAANGLLTINREFTASLVLARCHETPTGSYRWLLRLDNSLNPDVTIAARLQPGNQEIMDYYLFPRMAELASKLRLSSDNGIVLDVYRF